MSYIDVWTRKRKVQRMEERAREAKRKKTVCCANLRGLSIEERASLSRLRSLARGGSVETIAEMALVR